MKKIRKIQRLISEKMAQTFDWTKISTDMKSYSKYRRYCLHLSSKKQKSFKEHETHFLTRNPFLRLYLLNPSIKLFTLKNLFNCFLSYCKKIKMKLLISGFWENGQNSRFSSLYPHLIARLRIFF